MEFVAMKSIDKKLKSRDEECSDWTATEKVHGSSFQFYTSDGITVHVASRRRALGIDGSFLKCNIKTLLDKYEGFTKRLWEIVANEEKWSVYRSQPNYIDNSDDDEDGDDREEGDDKEKVEEEGDESNGQKLDEDHEKGQVQGLASESSDNSNKQNVRIYGELYGGGGIEADLKRAVQKEIIYSDEFRFYVFGITINMRWTTISELNELCHNAGFPYYAMPVCEPKATLRELKEWLMDNNFMNRKSCLTDRTDDHKTFIEGVVMTPLTRKDFRLHAVKLLANAFNDVRAVPKDKTGKTPTKLNYCTQARYHSVISKLDIPEREQTDLVANMFIQDIIKESGDDQVSDKIKEIWRGMVVRWLTEDGYHGNPAATKTKNKKTEDDVLEGNDQQEDEEGFFDLFS